MLLCWREDPHRRPTFARAHHLLKKNFSGENKEELTVSPSAPTAAAAAPTKMGARPPPYSYAAKQAVLPTAGPSQRPRWKEHPGGEATALERGREVSSFSGSDSGDALFETSIDQGIPLYPLSEGKQKDEKTKEAPSPAQGLEVARPLSSEVLSRKDAATAAVLTPEVFDNRMISSFTAAASRPMAGDSALLRRDDDWGASLGREDQREEGGRSCSSDDSISELRRSLAPMIAADHKTRQQSRVSSSRRNDVTPADGTERSHSLSFADERARGDRSRTLSRWSTADAPNPSAIGKTQRYDAAKPRRGLMRGPRIVESKAQASHFDTRTLFTSAPGVLAAPAEDASLRVQERQASSTLASLGLSDKTMESAQSWQSKSEDDLYVPTGAISGTGLRGHTKSAPGDRYGGGDLATADRVEEKGRKGRPRHNHAKTGTGVVVLHGFRLTGDEDVGDRDERGVCEEVSLALGGGGDGGRWS